MAEMDALISTLSEGVEGRHEVLSAYLFGSSATGHVRSGSDVDIAIRLVADLSTEERFRIRLELIECLEMRIDRNVDVVVLNDAAHILVNQVFTHGIPVFIRDPNDEERFKVLKLKEFFDFRYYLDRDFEQMREYFAGGGNGRQ